MLYSIEIRYHGKDIGRFITLCDNNGYYSSSPFPNRIFTREEAINIAEKIKQRYIYSIRLKSDETDEIISCLKSDVPFKKTSLTVKAITNSNIPKKGLTLIFGKK